MKQYNGEKAIISLTSWKARINTVSKTIYSLIQKCPGFHIVLCLSEEEFPKKEEELPDDLMLFVENDLIEILWVYKNYKSFKKVLFTMDKYRDVPIISADDDCIYTCNYAKELYQTFLANGKNKIITYHLDRHPKINIPCGQATIYPPNCFILEDLLLIIEKELPNGTSHDDYLYALMAKKNKIIIRETHIKNIFVFMSCSKNGITAMHRKLRKQPFSFLSFLLK